MALPPADSLLKKEDMHEELQTAVSSGKITEKQAEILEVLQPGNYCTHRSWGFGKVAEWNMLTGQMVIDFESKKGHTMQAGYAANSLKPIPNEHTLGRLRIDADGVRTQAKEDPVSFMRGVLTDFGGKATSEQITTMLVPDLMPQPSFKKWWDATKKKLKADGHFVVPAKRTDPLQLRDEAISKHADLFEQFENARTLKQQAVVLDEIVKHLPEFKEQTEKTSRLVREVEDTATKGQNLHASAALEMLLSRDEICDELSIPRTEGSLTVPQFLESHRSELATLISDLPAAKQRRILPAFKEAFPENWPERMVALLPYSSSRLVADISKFLRESDQADLLKKELAKMISDRSASREVLFWICKERGEPFPELFSVQLFTATLHTLEHEQSESGKGSSRLHDLLFDDRELIPDLLEKAEPTEIRHAVRRLLMSTVFDELNKRSLLARIIKNHPEMQSLVSGEDEKQEESLIVSWTSLDRRKQEYDDLVNRQIPQNTKDIQIARSYGDLRENHEFKSAKEMQAVLMRQKSELEQLLGRARGTNFENPNTTVVSIGTTVKVREVNSGEEETYHILGAWDTAPDKHFISYQAALGQSLLGKGPGELVSLQTETDDKSVKIESIEAFKDLELLEQSVQLAR